MNTIVKLAAATHMPPMMDNKPTKRDERKHLKPLLSPGEIEAVRRASAEKAAKRYKNHNEVMEAHLEAARDDVQRVVSRYTNNDVFAYKNVYGWMVYPWNRGTYQAGNG